MPLILQHMQAYLIFPLWNVLQSNKQYLNIILSVTYCHSDVILIVTPMLSLLSLRCYPYYYSFIHLDRQELEADGFDWSNIKYENNGPILELFMV